MDDPHHLINDNPCIMYYNYTRRAVYSGVMIELVLASEIYRRNQGARSATGSPINNDHVFSPCAGHSRPRFA